jgi:hypothetical protein
MPGSCLYTIHTPIVVKIIPKTPIQKSGVRLRALTFCEQVCYIPISANQGIKPRVPDLISLLI